MPVPSSTKRGSAVLAFPDVCKTPTPGGPVPIPYPNIASQGTPDAQKVPSNSRPSTSRSLIPTPEAQQLRGKLNNLHTQLMGLPGTDPNRWHSLVDAYVMTAASLYIAISSQ
jgi:hypothetical protein